MLSTLMQGQFEYNIPPLWLKPLKCAVCSADLTTKGIKQHGHRPLIMKCFHTVCEFCCLKPRPVVLVCRICKETTRIERNRSIHEDAEIHYYIYGLLNYMEFNLDYDVKRTNSFMTRDPKNQMEKTCSQECSECCRELTNSFCVQCRVPYCRPCFDNVHRHGKALQQHCLSQIGNGRKPSFRFEDKRCRQHNTYVNMYCTDCKAPCCLICAQKGHPRHRVTNILEENHRVMSQITSLMETVRSAREMNKQAQKDVKYVLKRFEDYASEAITSISNYFNYLHAALQSIERKAQYNVRDNAVRLISKVQRHQETLKKGHENLEDIYATLQSSCNNVPMNFLVSRLIENTNHLLESVPCNVSFKGTDINPFEFIEKKVPPVDFPNLYELNIDIGSFQPHILTFFGDASSLEYSRESIEASPPIQRPRDLNATAPPKLTKKGKKQKPKKQTGMRSVQSEGKAARAEMSLSNISSASFIPKQLTTQKVHVSHIINPENFYVQVQTYLAIQTEIQEIIMNEVEYAPSPDYIEIGEIYLVFNLVNRTWFRGEVLNSASKDLYKVFLIDYGNTIQVPKQRFHVISETLKSKPPGAIHCSLYAIKPTRNEWNDKAFSLMSEIIVNEMVNLVIYKEDTIYQVDLITSHLNYPTSIRNALIFAELARDDIDISIEMQKRVQQLSGVRKSLLTPPTEKFYKNVFKEGESFRAIILNVKDPHDFYAIKYDYKAVLDGLYEELNNEYRGRQQKLFTPLVNTPCAVFLKESWYRARITKISSHSNISVWLVDKAEYEIASCDQLRALQSKFLTINECAFQCALADIEPLQKNNYSWTPTAIAEFKRIIQNPVLQIFVHRTQNFLHQVGLYIIKKDIDVNVNALLVKYKHANSIGSESQHIEYPKVVDNPEPDEDMLHDINIMEMTLNEKSKTNSSVRTKVKICHIVSPGEFYLRKMEHLPGINKLHDEIQSYRKKDESSPSKPFESDDGIDETPAKWEIDGICLAQLSLAEADVKQWYRAVIKDISEANEESKFTVFLRDYGRTIEGISAENIAPIPGLYNRVCDGAIKCHMACIQPTGGLASWSGAAMDEFKASMNRFEEFAASIQGARESDSIPVILWALRRECSDPLAPTLFKWVNMNKFLSNSGLVHLTEKFSKLTEDNALECDIQDGQETFDEWLEKVHQTVEKSINPVVTILKRDSDDDEMCISEAELFSGDEENAEFTYWLPAREIKKSVFVGIPTFVDNDGLIYMYDSANKNVFDNIGTVVNRIVKKTRKGHADSFWFIGQPCLAQYTVDSKYYRATVLETKPDRRVSVQFVDFGNVQDCSSKDLRKNVVLTNIPIQVSKYRLDGVVPLEGKSQLSLDALDYLYSNIVTKPCAIRVSDNQENEEIKLCSIKCGPNDMVDMLVEAGFARRSPAIRPRESFLDVFMRPIKQSSSTLKWSQIKDSDTSSEIAEASKKKEDNKEEENVSIENSDIVVEEIVSRKASTVKDDHEEINEILDTNAYQQLFEKIDLDQLCATKKRDDSSRSDSDLVETTYKPSYCTSVHEPGDPYDESCALVVDNDTTPSSFDPQEMSTSTQLNKQPTYDIQPFNQFVLPPDTKTFRCEVNFMINNTTIAVYPLISSHKKLILEMSKNIQIAAALAPKLKQFEPKTPCLAIYSEDKMWYRALTRSYDADDNRVEVIFVDFFNTEWVSSKKIRQCPADLVSIPLRNIPVKLAGIKPNPRWRSVDIQRRFSELVEDRRVLAKVVSFVDNIATVELFENVESDDLIYEPMIAERFYLKN